MATSPIQACAKAAKTPSGVSLQAGAHLVLWALTLAHQRSTGDAGYDYGADGGGTIWLANSIQVKDFNAEDETPGAGLLRPGHGHFGVPGLSFMARYVAGDNATYEGTTQIADDASRWERNWKGNMSFRKVLPRTCPCACVKPLFVAMKLSAAATTWKMYA